ncbi:MAG: hypothetical protein HY698_03495 [Deltaproteobacteria bacterium]|nr:hypothetical protein [Deltaproteobacteria bacterium]
MTIVLYILLGAGLGAGVAVWLVGTQLTRAKKTAVGLRTDAEHAHRRIEELERAIERMLDVGARKIEEAVREADRVLRTRGEARGGLAQAIDDLERSLVVQVGRGFDGGGLEEGDSAARLADQFAEEQVQRVRALVGESESLVSASEQAMLVADVVSSVLREFERGADGLSQASSEAARAAAQLDDAVRKGQNGAGETAQISGKVSAEAEKGYRAVHKTLDEIERIRDLTETARKRIDALGVRVLGIGDVVRVIQEIAEKTNLLALNASIIAAQAGEHGRSFAVVAQEIKALANKTAASTKQIGEQIRGVQEESERAMEAMANGVTAVGEGFQVALGAGDALGEIRQSTRTAQKKVQAITRAMDEQGNASRRVVEAAGQLASRAAALSTSVKDHGNDGDRLRELALTLVEAGSRIGRLSREQMESGRMISDSVSRVVADALGLLRSQKELARQLGRLHQGATQLQGVESDVVERLSVIVEAAAQLREEIGRVRN